jgi:methylmalonyl-CoA epimerase
MFKEVHHIGIAAADMEAAIHLYVEGSGAKLVERELSRDGTMDIAMLWLGNIYIEILAPKQGESAIRKFIEKRGEGLHHVAYEVKDIEGELARLKAAGYELIDEKPRGGAMRSTIAFVKPKSTQGVLWELVVPPADEKRG